MGFGFWFKWISLKMLVGVRDFEVVQSKNSKLVGLVNVEWIDRSFKD